MDNDAIRTVRHYERIKNDAIKTVRHYEKKNNENSFVTQ